jgi:catechol 2,3-dioxygenase-like lactoylglutathione lyase family enzyme
VPADSDATFRAQAGELQADLPGVEAVTLGGSRAAGRAATSRAAGDPGQPARHPYRDRSRSVIGRLHHVIVDCPDPGALGAFYSELLGLPVTWQQADFVVISRDNTTSGIAFQLAPDYQPPQWPDPARPQQMHFDVMVDDVAAAEPRVQALGACRLPGGDSRSPVYADPAGHPFCLIPRPGWAAPIGDSPGA